MPINARPHISQNVFLQQSYSKTNTQKTRGLRQDKARKKSARIASHHPAPREEILRAQQLNNNTSRSQNKPTPKRKTVQLTLWVKPIVKAELTRIAGQEGLSVSAAGGAFLEKALQQNVDMHYGSLLQPIIREAITKQMRSMSTRLAWLLVRIAFDAGQTRSLVTNILGRQDDVTPAILNEILDNSSKTAKANITRRTPQISQLIEAVEKWMISEGEGNKNNE
jgi:hypothetical protein